MHVLHKTTFMAALALGALPVSVPAGEAAATSAAAQGNTEKKLADAQQRLDAAAREVAELSRQMGRRFNLRTDNAIGAGVGAPPRALLGINVDTNSTRDGARVMDVSPGGAAAEAGIKPGDLITGIADLDLTKDSNPSRALVEKMNQLEPEQKVKVAVLRDGRKLNFDIAPRAAPQDVFVSRLDTRGPGVPGGPRAEVRQFIAPTPGRRGPEGPDGPQLGRGPGPDISPRGNADLLIRDREGAFVRERGGAPELREERIQVLQGMFSNEDQQMRFGGAELASLSERLGSYFGVKAGVLVVRAGVDSPFKLQDGDVILAVDGREVSTAQQAGRILRSYQPGEKLTLKVQRDRKVQNLEITAPGGRKPN
jgi:membrane-associated protease RseP (regulator of RpoE activity)